jgi:hypothetical protein
MTETQSTINGIVTSQKTAVMIHPAIAASSYMTIVIATKGRGSNQTVCADENFQGMLHSISEASKSKDAVATAVVVTIAKMDETAMETAVETTTLGKIAEMDEIAMAIAVETGSVEIETEDNARVGETAVTEREGSAREHS